MTRTNECRTCGNILDRSAKACPKCGRKKTGCFSYFIIIMAVVFVLSYAITRLV